jgi:hypothetical protein
MAKKNVEAGPPPNKNMLIAAIVLMVLGSLWAVYELNPGGALRAETEKEKKEREEEKKKEDEKKRHAGKKKTGGH